MQAELILFIHLAGIIIALGAVTVIDVMGFISRDDKKWTQTTIAAHHVTKPLIWVGTGLMAGTWITLYNVSQLAAIKTVLIGILIANGAFLSFYVSPRLDELKSRKVLLPASLQQKIMISMPISFVSWWSLVYITVKMIM